LVVGSEYEVYGIDEVRKQKAPCNQGSDQSEEAKVRDISGDILDPVEKIRIELGKEFIREDIETPEYEF
jgi:hypothetical protein